MIGRKIKQKAPRRRCRRWSLTSFPIDTAVDDRQSRVVTPTLKTILAIMIFHQQAESAPTTEPETDLQMPTLFIGHIPRTRMDLNYIDALPIKNSMPMPITVDLSLIRDTAEAVAESVLDFGLDFDTDSVSENVVSPPNHRLSSPSAQGPLIGPPPKSVEVDLPLSSGSLDTLLQLSAAVNDTERVENSLSASTTSTTGVKRTTTATSTTPSTSTVTTAITQTTPRTPTTVQTTQTTLSTPKTTTVTTSTGTLAQKYSYGYSIADKQTGDYKSAQEERQGDSVQGEYRVLEPDGLTLRVVRYWVSPGTGFRAEIKFEKVDLTRRSTPQREIPTSPSTTEMTTETGNINNVLPDGVVISGQEEQVSSRSVRSSKEPEPEASTAAFITSHSSSADHLVVDTSDSMNSTVSQSTPTPSNIPKIAQASRTSRRNAILDRMVSHRRRT
ncbi:unnamed protein product [Notodromas monacha]|uniref:Uncharacterized protein n=1 Tax=Notodromas monacha TaxID=399045 RepID=A0A7R9BRU9_9CRUS|nr:unnamed protein product [Notodromas monacha]CAG0920539.1 unnamed protein product [Notodromas monacha]